MLPSWWYLNWICLNYVNVGINNRVQEVCVLRPRRDYLPRSTKRFIRVIIVKAKLKHYHSTVHLVTYRNYHFAITKFSFTRPNYWLAVMYISFDANNNYHYLKYNNKY